MKVFVDGLNDANEMERREVKTGGGNVIIKTRRGLFMLAESLTGTLTVHTPHGRAVVLPVVTNTVELDVKRMFARGRKKKEGSKK